MVNDKRPMIKLFIDYLIREFSKNFISSHAFNSVLIELGVG